MNYYDEHEKEGLILKPIVVSVYVGTEVQHKHCFVLVDRKDCLP